jgi:hypothetical protein
MSCQTLCAEDRMAVEDQLTVAVVTNSEIAGHAAAPLNRPLRRIVYGPNTTPNGFTGLAGEWNHLLKRSRANVFFLTYEWQTTWWEALGAGDLWIVAFRTPDTNELVGIAPLYLAERNNGVDAGKRVFT